MPDLLGPQSLLAHGGVSLQGVHNGAQNLVGQIRRVGELFLSVVRNLLGQDLRLHELSLDDVVHGDQLVINTIDSAT